MKLGLAITVLFFIVHLIGLTRHSFWIDELHTYGATRLSVKDLVENRFRAGHLPTYFLMIKGWCRLVGYSEGTMRFPSVIFAAFSFFAFFLFCRRFVKDDRTFSIAILLFFFHPFLFWASQEARMYSLLIFICIISSFSLLYFLESRKFLPLVFYFVSVLFGLGLHLIFTLQIVIYYI